MSPDRSVTVLWWTLVTVALGAAVLVAAARLSSLPPCPAGQHRAGIDTVCRPVMP